MSTKELYIARFRAERLSYRLVLSERTFSIPFSSHEGMEFLFLKKGDITYRANGKVYHPGKNSLIIMRPLDYYAMSVNSSEPYERHIFYFDPDFLPENLYDMLPRDVDVIDCDGNELMRSLFRKLPYYIEHLDDKTAKMLLIGTIREIFCNAVILSKQANASKPYASNPLIEQAVQYIQEHITQPISIDDLTNHLSISKSHLEHLFTKHLNITPKKYITARKLTYARQELWAGSSATEVCVKYSFQDYSTFYRQYRNYYGHKPSETASIDDLYETNS